MNMFCYNCGLKSDIEEYRQRLNNIIINRNQNLIDDEVVKLSQFLDELVYKCVTCKKDLNSMTKLKLSLDNIFGIHSTFYYYGIQHLFTSMYFYINKGIHNNELIYISMLEEMYIKLRAFLMKNNVSVEHIQFRPVKELILSSKNGGLNGLKEKINNICLEKEAEKYSGVRWIGQPTYAIQVTSQKDFLNWEINLNKALEDTNVSLICIYDAYDYMHEGIYINKEVIDKSLDTHSFILKDLGLEEIS